MICLWLGIPNEALKAENPPGTNSKHKVPSKTHLVIGDSGNGGGVLFAVWREPFWLAANPELADSNCVRFVRLLADKGFRAKRVKTELEILATLEE